MKIDWTKYDIATILRHKDCGEDSELKVIAKAGVDTSSVVEVVAMACSKCGKVVTNLEDKEEIEHWYELYFSITTLIHYCFGSNSERKETKQCQH